MLESYPTTSFVYVEGLLEFNLITVDIVEEVTVGVDKGRLNRLLSETKKNN